MTRLLFFVLAAALFATVVHAQETKEQKDARMAWWREARFGMFIHWGLYAIPAGKWGDAQGHGEWIRETAQIPIGTYEKFKDQFNPTGFDANEWAALAKQAGMKYVVITTKHHDGFALFDSKHTDWDVMSTPYKRDIMKELSTAVRNEGLSMCWYHSIMDWHHPDYLPRRNWEVAQRPVGDAQFDRYVDFLHRQVTELLTNYGPIGVMWFDGEWESTWNHRYGQPLYELCRSVQPNVIVNNRVDVGRGGMAGFSDAGYAGDFGTPEQEIPATGLPGVDWETCMTMNDHWGYCEADLNFKSSEQIVRMLCDVASKGGNYLLNVGPTAEGKIPPESIERLKEVGKWMQTNGEAIYGTSSSPFDSLDWGRCTVRIDDEASDLYLHIFDWPADDRLVVPGLGNRVLFAEVLGQETVPALGVRKPGETGVSVSLAGVKRQPFATVVKLRLQGRPIVYRKPVIQFDSAEFVNPMTVQVAVPEGLSATYTLDGSAPDARSQKVEGPIPVVTDCTLRVTAFHDGRAVSESDSQKFTQVVPLPATTFDGVDPGLRLYLVQGTFDECATVETTASSKPQIVSQIGLSDEAEYIGHIYEGWIKVPADDVYKFALMSDDGSKLWIDNVNVVDNDGLHSPSERRGTMALSVGWHRIKVVWFNKTGGAVLDLKWGKINQALEPVSASSLGHKTKE